MPYAPYAYSAIEFLFLFKDEVFEQIAPRAWLDQIAPDAMRQAYHAVWMWWGRLGINWHASDRL